MEQFREKNTFTLWQYPLLISHLEEMAQKGWMLCDYDGVYLTYNSAQPQKVHFAVTFFPDYDFLDPVPPPALERLWDFCAQHNWQHVTDNSMMQIFCSTDPDPVPLHTDAAVQLENFDAMMKADKVKQWKQNTIIDGAFIVFIVALLIAVSNEQSLGAFIKRASPVALLLVIKNFYTFITNGTRWLNYSSWYKKAKTAAMEYNIFFPPKENIQLQKADNAVLVAFAAALVLVMIRSGSLVESLIWCGIIFGFIAFYILLLRIMKKKGFSAKENRTVAAAVIIAVIVLLIIFFPYIAMLLKDIGIGGDFITVTTVYPQ